MTKAINQLKQAIAKLIKQRGLSDDWLVRLDRIDELELDSDKLLILFMILNDLERKTL